MLFELVRFGSDLHLVICVRAQGAIVLTAALGYGLACVQHPPTVMRRSRREGKRMVWVGVVCDPQVFTCMTLLQHPEATEQHNCNSEHLYSEDITVLQGVSLLSKEPEERAPR
jgi:hypothetical protein